MNDVGKYCCFECPKDDFEEKKLSDSCCTCGRKYDFPLIERPEKIGEYIVTRTLGRGFYACTYIAERQGVIRRKHVLKIAPKKIYKFFNKNFDEECAAHARAADGADYIVDIVEAFESLITFGGLQLDCHVAVLQYVDGHLLHDYLSGARELTSGRAAQIAADLFRIHAELQARLQNHNDFHAGNIIVEQLSPKHFRQGAMDPSICAIAIDLGSLSEDRRSGGQYKSDLHWIAKHIERLSDQLLDLGMDASDLDARLSLALKQIAQSIIPAVEHQRTPTADEIVKTIEEEFFRSSEPWRPWRKPLTLRKFGDSYNAQTLEPWNVPQLLVDPDGCWQKAISSPGPQVVTGMRGCGKTMLLRSIQFHARARRQADESDQTVMERITGDDYVGFFVSAQSLLTLKKEHSLNAPNMFGRLVIAYGLEAARALAHLSDIDPTAVAVNAGRDLQSAIYEVLDGCEPREDIVTIQQLERHLITLLHAAFRTNSKIQIASHPSSAFPLMAAAIRRSANIWRDAQVLFLLDDVSTRYLTADQVEEILSALIFQKPDCAFKLTSESQAIFLNLKSPGGVEPASHMRDFDTFDLGADVHNRIKRTDGRKFVEEILEQRARFFSGHPATPPVRVLGDQKLVDIAKAITASGPNSSARKAIYHGISAIKAVCVGDIGSAITLYENILNRAEGRFPVTPQIQSNVYQDFCSTHLYFLDRRGSHLKSVAKAFAAASYELLMESAAKGGSHGYRQYASIYVRVTAGDKEEQGKRLRELVDAGVFVFQGGAPRTKTKDSDPMQQFKLTFRKIFGLADFIGLAERDRFELSGNDLQDWLSFPERGKEILLRNLSTASNEGDEPETDSADVSVLNEEIGDGEAITAPAQGELTLQGLEPIVIEDADPSPAPIVKLPIIRLIEHKSRVRKQVDVLYLAFGFEKRTEVSVSRALEILNPRRIIAVRYENEEGRTEGITSTIKKYGIRVDVIKYQELSSATLTASSVAIDITGLTKAAIFRTVRSALVSHSDLSVIYTEAEEYYPLETTLKNKVSLARENGDYHALLSGLKDVLSGEEGPYTIEELHSIKSDETRMKILFAFGSAKHERLIHLVETKDFDIVKIVVDSSETARNTIARFAAEVAVRGAESGSIEACDIQNPEQVLKLMELAFRNSYYRWGMNFEVGLTGDKLETVAAAAFCSTAPVNKVWYVRPEFFDVKRFSNGTGRTYFYQISMP